MATPRSARTTRRRSDRQAPAGSPPEWPFPRACASERSGTSHRLRVVCLGPPSVPEQQISTALRVCSDTRCETAARISASGSSVGGSEGPPSRLRSARARYPAPDDARAERIVHSRRVRSRPSGRASAPSMRRSYVRFTASAIECHRSIPNVADAPLSRRAVRTACLSPDSRDWSASDEWTGGRAVPRSRLPYSSKSARGGRPDSALPAPARRAAVIAKQLLRGRRLPLRPRTQLLPSPGTGAPRARQEELTDLKIGINRWTLPPALSLAECFRLAKRSGFDSIEINIAEDGELTTASDEASVRSIVASARDAGIQLSSLSTGLGWKYPLGAMIPACAIRRSAVVRKSLEVASWMGVDTILVVPGVVNADARTTMCIDLLRKGFEPSRRMPSVSKSLSASRMSGTSSC